MRELLAARGRWYNTGKERKNTMKLRNGRKSTTRISNAAMARLAVHVLALALAALLPATSLAGVWNDCVLWYNGGAVDANGDGKFTNGEMLDVRHAGNAGSPTHGGTLMNDDPDNDTVLIETNEVVFSLQNSRKQQCPVLNFSAPAETNNDVITVYGNRINIPNVLSADDNTYTALIRFRREEHHAWDSSFQAVMEIGRNLSSARGLGIALSNSPADNTIKLEYGNTTTRNTDFSFSSGKGGWHEVAVIVNGTSVTIGIATTNHNTTVAMRWKTITGLDPNALKPYDTSLTLGGSSVATPATPGKTLFRGQIHMVSLWNRVLTTNEVMEAFSFAPTPSSPSLPSLFQVGFPGIDGGEMFAGSAGPASIMAMTAKPEEWRKFPVSLSRGDPVNISFMLDAVQTNLPQIVRLVPRAGSSGSVSVSVNGVNCGTEDVRGGVDTCVYVPAECLGTVGENVCTITRADSGSGTLGFNAVQMAGSWRIGYDDGSWGDTEGAGATEEDFYVEWSSRDWKLFRRAVLENSTKKYPLNVHLGDLLGRWGNNRYVYTWKLQKSSGDNASMVVKLNGSTVAVKSNGSTVECPVALNDTQWHTYTLELDENNLLRGVDNVLTWENPSATYYGFDYHEMIVRKPRKGFVITFR